MSISLNPATFDESGGLWSNIDVRWSNARFVSDWDYKGKAEPVTAFVVDMIDLVDGNPMEPQAWVCGAGFSASQDDKTPAKAGDYLIGSGALKKSSNLSILMESIGVAIPDNLKEKALKELFEPGKASVFEGMECHMIRKVVKRDGIGTPKINPKTGKAYEPTGVPIVDMITKFPWDKTKKAPPGVKAAVGGAKPAAAKSATKEAAPASDLDAQVVGIITSAIGDNPDGLLKDDLLAIIHKSIKIPKVRQAALELANDPEFLNANGAGVYSYDEESDTLYPEA